jgi:Protein of unknown function (DUF3014)
MTDLPDYDLHRTPDEDPVEPPPSHIFKWVIVAVVALAAIGVVWYAVSRRAPAEQAAATAPAPAPTPQPEPALGSTPEAVQVPPLDESDAFVRTSVKQLSTHPVIASWLATNGLVRNFTVVVVDLADGKTPAPQLDALRPKAGFLVSDQGEQLTVDPRGYARYDRFADALASIDPQDAAKLYATLKPRITEAYRDLGFPNTDFDRTLTRAIVILLKTPTPKGPIEVEPHGAAAFAFADPNLETLPGAQKQLLRMGPANAQKVKAALRLLALALGIPERELPAAG